MHYSTNPGICKELLTRQSFCHLQIIHNIFRSAWRDLTLDQQIKNMGGAGKALPCLQQATLRITGDLDKKLRRFFQKAILHGAPCHKQFALSDDFRILHRILCGHLGSWFHCLSPLCFRTMLRNIRQPCCRPYHYTTSFLGNFAAAFYKKTDFWSFRRSLHRVLLTSDSIVHILYKMRNIYTLFLRFIPFRARPKVQDTQTVSTVYAAVSSHTVFCCLRKVPVFAIIETKNRKRVKKYYAEKEILYEYEKK